MSRQIRFAALLLAVSLLCNIALPAMAVESADTSVSASDGETTAPTGETTTPTEETTTPTEETTAPTEETTAPTEETESPIEEITYPMPFEQPEDNTLYITTARELLRLSYVEPQEYCGLTLVFDPGDEGDAVFDLATETDDPAFLGLGSEEYPFQGEILFAEEAGPIVMNRPLFNALSDDAKITGLSLESRIQGAVEGGLLAQTVTHGQGGNAWSIILTNPELAKDAQANLLPLVSELGNDVDVSLDLTDLSGLAVLGSGYLCAVMGENARVTLSGVQSIPLVTGQSNDVGGLVGQMKSGASLTVLGESIGLGGVSGSWNVGGIVGSAEDPSLTLPAIEGGSGASVCGENVGGLVGRLTCSPGDHTLALSVSGLTLEGSGSVGGLFGVFSREEGSVTLNAQADGIVFAEGAEDCGSLTGAYYANSLEDPLKLNGELIADDAGLEAIAGFVDYPGKPENTESITAAEEAQAIIDSIRKAELRPGEMSPFWWAVVCGKITAEDLEAEIAAAYSDSAEGQEADNSPAAVSISQRRAAPIAQDEEAEAAALALLEAGISAYSDPTLPWPAGKTEYEIQSAADLVLLSYVAPSEYATGEIKINMNAQEGVLDVTKPCDLDGKKGATFQGLSDADNPFKGTFTLTDGSSGTYIKLDRPLFKTLSDEATIAKINLYSGMKEVPSGSKALLAETVTHTENGGNKTWGINLKGITGRLSLPLVETMAANSRVGATLSLCVGTVRPDANGGDVENSFAASSDCSGLTVQGGGYLCSTMEQGAQLAVTLNKDATTALGVPKVSGSDAVGGLVGTMAAGASLTVTANGSLPIMGAESTNGNAGGLVGTMDDAASVTITGEGAALTLSNVSASEYAGGLIGEATNPVLALPAITGSTNSTIKSTGSDAGGLVGHLSVKCAADGTTFTLGNTIENLTVNGNGSSGGLFGRFDNLGGTYTIQGITSTVTFKPESAAFDSKAGGLIGTYVASGLRDALILKGNTTTSTLSSGVNKYGGLIGYVWRESAYIQISSGTVTTTEWVKPGYYGGLIAELSDLGHFVQVGDPKDSGQSITIKQTDRGTSNKFSGTTAGGLVGKMPSGVLALDVQPTLTSGTQIDADNDKRGWVLGDRGNTLVYTTVADWATRTGEAAKYTNDTGVWGQVLRVDSGSSLNNLLTVSDTEHTVTVKSATDASASAATISDVFDFAAVALRLQLNPTGALQFTGGDFDSSSQVSITLSSGITNPINLNGTGLTGLTRDVNSTEVFNLTINGSGKTITLPDLTVYTASNGHDRQGLIGKAGTLDVNGLTVSGDVTYYNLGKLYAGGVLAEATGNFTLNNVTSSVAMTINGGGDDNCAFSGFVGSTTKACQSMAFNGCTFSGGITDNTGKNSYIGGMLAYANNNEANDNSSFTVSADNCSISNAAITVSGALSNYARVGGLFASLYYGKYTLKISDLRVSGLAISVENITGGKIDKDPINPKFCGGLLGCEWMKVDATIQNVTIENSRLNAGAVPFGGLVYKSSGYWKVKTKNVTVGESEVTKPGIHFTGTNSFTGGSPNAFPSGLLVSRGDNILNSDGKKRDALYMEIGEGAYKIDPDSVTVTVPDGRYFDEIVGITEGDNGNGIVSIGTAANGEGKRLIDQSGCNTYQKQLSKDYDNPNTRYYYNLDSFQDNGDKIINTPEEMVLLSAHKHADSSISSNFGITGNVITGDDLDLSGYSYYPFPADGSISINNANVKFDYQNLENKEKDNKKPSDSDRQHYGMHTGLFTDVGSAAAKASLTINGLTLRGTVGGSAIINGTARGKDSENMTTLNISKVKLDGIRTVATEEGLHPLLINRIESFTKLNLTDVTTTDSYSDLGDTRAATSLIGNVGEDGGGQYLQLVFAQIALDGSTTGSIFSTALFLQEFQYTDSNSWGVYNFTQNDGPNREKYYTLGKELSNAESETLVRNGGEQFWFYGTEDYVYCVEAGKENSEGTPEGAAEYFATGYLPYVNDEENSPHHQMDINLSSKDIIEGCGTYSDPYIIEYGKQLSAVAKVLNGESPKMNWKITMNTTVLIDGLSSQDGHSSSENDKTFTWNGSAWVCDGESSPADTAVIDYLRNAYYLLKNTQTEENVGNDGKISLSSNWGGLGSKDHPFQGVIVGDGVTVHIDVKTGNRFGGLIAFSTGSVVKNVNIHYDGAPSITAKDLTPSNIDAPFFGGVVGWCIGGDTIIDNVSVTYTDAPTVTGTMAYLVPVGGYVGMVGGTEGFSTTSDGLGGGVVFRGTNTSTLSSVSVGGISVTPSDENSNYFYVNPYVGRVLDGYAIKEAAAAAEEDTGTPTTTFINTDKNYQIPTLSSPGLSIEGSKISVSNNEGLWLLSAIVNSGAGSNTAKAYSGGKARFWDYGNVGKTMPGGEGADEDSDASPYLIRKYGLDALKAKINDEAVSIELTGDCDMTKFGNGFRGIGGSYSKKDNVNRQIKVSQLDGGNHSVKLAQSRKEYLAEKDYWISIGTGLFVQLYQDTNSNSTIIKNLTLKGNTGITYYNGTSSDSNSALNTAIKDSNLYDIRLNQVGAGMLASSVAKMGTTDLTIENVKLDNVTVNPEGVGSVFAGGLIGVIWGGGGSKNTEYLTVTLKDCAYTNPTVRGFVDAGGFIGRVRAEKAEKYAEIVITYSEAKSLTGGNIATTSTAYERGSNFSTVGGLIGSTHYYDLAIQPEGTTDAMLTVSGLTVKSGYMGNTGDKVFGGGLVGLCYTPKTNCTIQNVRLEGNNSISGANNNNRRQLLGGLIGVLTNKFGWNDSGSASVTASNIHIAESGSLKLQYAQQAGALFGILNIGGQIQLRNITIGSDGNSPSVMIANVKSDGSYSNIGGLIGGGNALKNVSLNDVKINNTYVLLDNNSGKTRGAALIFGFLENGSDTAKINLQDITLKNSYVVTGNQQTRAGFVYGFLNNQNSSAPAINGRNILIENCWLGYNASLASDINTDNFTLPALYTDGTAAGLVGGDCTNSHTSVKLVGVRVKNCTAPAQNFGTTNPKDDSYVIRADYSKAANEAAKITTVPTSNISIQETGASGAKVLTGDGACFTDADSAVPIAEQIIRDYKKGTTSNTYFSIGSAIKQFENADGTLDKLSTFHTAGEIEDKKNIPNFPVLVINSDEVSKADSIISDYIAVLTNDSVAPRRISAPVTYQWSFDAETKKGVFIKAESASLKVDTTGKLTITPGGYDNQRNQFTLLDVTYADPTGGGTSYHLYIPVIVKRVMQFRFWASAENGSSYNVTHYDGLRQSAIGSDKELITSLLTFEYRWTKKDWEAAVDGGLDLLWNFDKEVIFFYNNESKLPNTTRLTLVDCNNQDRVYYDTYSPGPDRNSDIVRFSSFSGWSSEKVPLCDLLKLKAEEYNDSTMKERTKFVACGIDDEGATLRIGTQYYRPATSEDTSGPYFGILVGLNEKELVKETYYLTIQAQLAADKADVYNFLIQCDARLKIPDGETGLPTTIDWFGKENVFAKNGSENRVVISNFYDQTILLDTVNSNQEMSAFNDSITGRLDATVTFRDKEKGFPAFMDAKGTERELMQQFCLSLKDQANNLIPFPAGTTIEIDGKVYSVEPGYYYWLPAQEVKNWQPNTDGNQSDTVSTAFTLRFTTNGIYSTFPVRTGEGSNDGIQVCASSSLAMDSTALKRSNQKVFGTDQSRRLFYRKEMSLATLFYNAYDIAYPTQASGLSNLGINGWETSSAALPSAAIYDASAVTTASEATQIKCTVDLLCKNSSGDGYTKVASSTNGTLGNYLDSIAIVPKVSVNGGYVTVEGNGFDFNLPGSVDWHAPVQIDVDLQVKSGEPFESNKMYANYKVLLTVELLKDGSSLEGSGAHDYIIYTNTKIVKELIS